jgi:hypothetical protein
MHCDSPVLWTGGQTDGRERKGSRKGHSGSCLPFVDRGCRAPTGSYGANVSLIGRTQWRIILSPTLRRFTTKSTG